MSFSAVAVLARDRSLQQNPWNLTANIAFDKRDWEHWIIDSERSPSPIIRYDDISYRIV